MRYDRKPLGTKYVTADDPDKSMWIQVGVIIGILTFTLVYLVMSTVGE
jgi:LPS O-antigen subunit length determinant protein (WzzB/FepE family)